MARFRILGSLEVDTVDGEPVTLTATKTRTLLGVLLLHANRPVSIAALTDALWPHKPPRTAAGALRTHVSTLRTSLRLTALTARTPGYQLDLPPCDLDMLLFDQLAEEGRQAEDRRDMAGAADLWERALKLWRGRPLDCVEVGAAAEATLADLAERRFTLLERWAQTRLVLGRHVETLPQLAAAAAEQPLREHLHELIMIALYRAGRQADALETFWRLRRRLITDLGVEPGPALQRLQRQILSADPELDRPPMGEPVTVDGAVPVPRQLPLDIAPFTGRHREIAAVRAQLHTGSSRHSSPIVAISGAAGIGKSALAIHVAHLMAQRFPDGQLYADLQGATAGMRPLPPLEVLGRFLRALGVRDVDVTTVGEASATFRAAVAPRRLLIVLDNAGDADQVRPLLPAGPHTVVLVTSRRILSTLDNAAHLRLEELSGAEAIELLGGLAGQDRVATDPVAAEQVAHWCGYLPLALRIAGARLAARPTWTLRELVGRLADARRRLDELRIAELGVRSSFQVSYEVLRDGSDPGDREAARLFPVLASADMADLSLPAVAALLDLPQSDAELVLERLVDAQLVAGPAPGRYRLHDLLRLFGQSLVDTVDPVPLNRLLHWYSATTWNAFRLLRPADRRPDNAGYWASGGLELPTAQAALAWLEAERPNLLAAVRQVAQTPELPAPAATSLARGLFAFFHLRGYLNDWIEVNQTAREMARRSGDRVAEAHACRDLGAAFEVRGEYQAAMDCLLEGLDRYVTASDRAGEAACLNGLGAVYDSLGRLDEAATCLERSLAISLELDDRHGAGISLNNLGDVYCRKKDYLRAAESLHAALTIFRGTGNVRSQAAALNNLANVLEHQGAYTDALSCYEQSYSLFTQLGISVGQATMLAALGRVLRLLGRHNDALDRLADAVAIAEQVGDRHGAATALRDLGITRHELGEIEAAQGHWRRALSLFEELGVPEDDEVRALLAAV